MMRRAFGAFALVGLVLTPGLARAQDTPLSRILIQLIQADILLAPPQSGTNHSAHFLPEESQQLAPFFFNQQMISQLASFPTGSSSGGFSYTFDPSVGTFTRATDSFGPSFAERALTVGKGKFTVGMNFQRSTYNSFEGVDLEDGEIKFFLRHEDAGGVFFERDLIETALRLKLSTTTTSFFVNYGATDRLDISVGVPIVHASLDATIDATVLQLATAGISPPIHAFPGGATTATFQESGSKTGIGDILVRAKYRFMPAPGGGLAFEIGGRLPTGDSENLLGTGGAQLTVGIIGSTSRGMIAPHFNAGFTFAANSDFAPVPNELGYRGGIDVVVNPRVTLSADLIGRTLIDAGRLVLEETTFNFSDINGTPGSRVINEFQARDGNLTTLLGAVGGKFNVAQNVLISANLLFGLNSAGLKANVTPVIGFDFTF
jgi:hypothetical protein